MTEATKKRPRRTKAGKPKAAGSARARSAQEGKALVVVESPAKARTINRYLGRDYLVRASMGHVRDLPKRQMGVDIEHGFEPTYEPLAGRKKVLGELKKHARAAPEVFLATDLDREGEAIAWHLVEALGVPKSKIRRVIFNEITAAAVREAFAHPRQIDMNKVNAQQARRILDRIVGYELSPLLWRKVAAGLSAGRVQSVAVRLIVDREREIDAFVPEEYWKIGAVFTPKLAEAGKLAREWAEFLARRNEKGNGPSQAQQQQFLAERGAFHAELATWRGERFRAGDVKQALQVAQALGLAVGEVRRSEDPKAKGSAKNLVAVTGTVSDAVPPFTVSKLQTRERRSRPPAPFTTASLQQTAAVRLRLSAARTMRTAQQLYEGVDVRGEGSVGLITYMRTDSTHVAAEAVRQVRGLIEEAFGRPFLPERPNVFAAGKRAQEAHEAIRPTDAARRPEDLRGKIAADQLRLYELIWQRFVASQMAPAVWEVTEADVSAQTPAGAAVFKAMGRRLKFEGYLRVAGLPRTGEQALPKLTESQRLAAVEIRPTQHFTQPPPRYTEASLVKALEADGIGRPSTYAAIIQTIQDRGYVEQIERAFRPTDLGKVVTDKLVAYFPRIFDVRFTAQMEDELDKVEDAEIDWVRVLQTFYEPFSDRLQQAKDEMVHAKAETEPSEYVCENCQRPMVYRFSRTGRYLACTGYPDCKTTHPVDKDGKKIEQVVVDVACPKCGQAMVRRLGKYGPFLSCSRYPDCDGVLNLDRRDRIKLPSAPPLAVELTCPKCGSPLYLRRSKRGPWLSCSTYPKCRGRLGFKTLKAAQKTQLEQKLLAHEAENPQPVVRTLDGRPIGSDHTPQALADGAPKAHEQASERDSVDSDDSPNC